MSVDLIPALIDARERRVALNPRDPAFYADPYPTYAAIRRAAPMFFWEDYGFWCFASYADVSGLLRDRRFGRQILHVMSREELGWPEPEEHLAPFLALEKHSLLELEPPEHTRLRALVNRAFVSRNIERLRPRIAALAREYIDRVRGEDAFDLIERFATPIPVGVIAEFLGAPLDMAGQFLAWSHRMVAMYQFGVTREVEERAAAASREFDAYLRTLVAARRKAPREDLISQLVALEAEGGRLSEDELVTTAILLLNAGHEATVHAIGNGVRAVLEHGLDAKAALEPEDGAELLTEEMLRFDSPLHMFTRYALEPVTVGGVALKRGEKIGLLLGAANRDPARFENPDAFDARRVNNAHVAFGAGIHFCVGAPLARLEMQVALPMLFDAFPSLSLAAPPKVRDVYHFHGLEALHVAP